MLGEVRRIYDDDKNKARSLSLSFAPNVVHCEIQWKNIQKAITLYLCLAQIRWENNIRLCSLYTAGCCWWWFLILFHVFNSSTQFTWRFSCNLPTPSLPSKGMISMVFDWNSHGCLLWFGCCWSFLCFLNWCLFNRIMKVARCRV